MKAHKITITRYCVYEHVAGTTDKFVKVSYFSRKKDAKEAAANLRSCGQRVRVVTEKTTSFVPLGIGSGMHI